MLRGFGILDKWSADRGFMKTRRIHSKYNPVERCWSSLERKWSGVLLNCVSFVLDCARHMTWKGENP